VASKTTKRPASKSRKPPARAASASRSRKATSARRAAAAKVSTSRKSAKTSAARRGAAAGRREKSGKSTTATSISHGKKPDKLDKKARVAGAVSLDGKKKSGEKPGTPPKPLVGKGGKPSAPEAKAVAGKQAAGKGRKPAIGAKSEESAREAINGAKPDKDGYILFQGRRVRVISTKNIKKRRPQTAAERAERAREAESKAEPDKQIKTKLSKKELDHYRDLLLLLRSQKLGDLSAKEAEALQSNGGNLSHMPIHMADIGTDAYDQDFTLGLAESDRRLIREIDEALGRIENKTYGMCLLTGKPIPKSRLNAKPWAKYTIEAARMVENGQVA